MLSRTTLARILVACLLALAKRLDGQNSYSVSTLYTFPGVNTGPSGVAVDSNGIVYLAGRFSLSSGASAIASLAPPPASGGNETPTIIAGGAAIGTSDGVGAAAQFNIPEGLSTDTLGNIYLTDTSPDSSSFFVREVIPATGNVITLSNSGSPNQLYPGANGVAISGSGATYISQALGGGGIVQYIPGSNPSSISVAPITDYQDGNGEAQSLGTFGVATDATGSIYATVPANGPYSTTGPGTIGTLGQEQLYVLKITGAVTTQLFAIPIGDDPQTQEFLSVSSGTVPVVVDSAGTVYVGWYGTVYGYTAKGGLLTVAQFGGPIVGLAADSFGRVYVAWGPPGYPEKGSGAGQLSLITPTTLLTSTKPVPSFDVALHLTNISTRAFVGSGANVAIAGFVVNGPSGSAQQVLVRGVGPTLSTFGVTGVLAQPVLTLFNSAGIQIASNTGWGTSPTITPAQFSSVFGQVGAFALPANSADSAIVITLPPGSYTAQVAGLNGTTGTALIEVYELPVP